MSIIDRGNYFAVATGMMFVESSQRKTPGVCVRFKLDDGREIEYVAWITSRTEDRVASHLGICGFDGIDPKTVCKNRVELVIDIEEYETESGLHRKNVVKFINTGRYEHTPLSAASARNVMDRLRGKILESKL